MRHIPYTLLVLAATAGFASAQATAYTTPVGYVTLDIPASSDSVVGLPLHKSADLQATSASVAGNVLTLSASVTGIVADQFKDTHYLKVNTGTLAGRVFPITANAASAPGPVTITVDQQHPSDNIVTQGLLASDSFSVIEYATLADAFPNGAGVGSSADPTAPDNILFFADQAGVGVNLTTSASFVYDGDNVLGNPGPSWLDANSLAVADTQVIHPNQLLIVRNGGAAKEIVFSGEVPSVQGRLDIREGSSDQDSFAPIIFPVDLSLVDSNLFPAVVSATNDPTVASDTVFVYDPAATGYNNPPSGVYVYDDGTTFGTPGWLDANTLDQIPVDSKVLKAGRGIVVRKLGGTPSVIDWDIPLPYTLP